MKESIGISSKWLHVLRNFTNVCYSLSLCHQMYQCYLHFNTTDLPGQELEMGPVMLQLMNGDHVLLVEPVILPECMFWNDASQSAINVNICGQLHSRYTLYFKQKIIIISKDQMGEK